MLIKLSQLTHPLTTRPSLTATDGFCVKSAFETFIGKGRKNIFTSGADLAGISYRLDAAVAKHRATARDLVRFAQYERTDGTDADGELYAAVRPLDELTTVSTRAYVRLTSSCDLRLLSKGV